MYPARKSFPTVTLPHIPPLCGNIIRYLKVPSLMQVTAQTVFTPTQPNGTVDVTFTFDGSQLWEKEVVVFDTLYRNGTEVAVHADITDKGQTVTFPKQPQEPEIPTEPPVPSEPKVPQTPKTGDNQWLLPTLISSLLVSTGILFAFVFHQKKHGENRRS